jgi:NAD(P)H dehydrogenase (quinone)
MSAFTQARVPAYQILVVYYSRFGAVELLAERIAEGARREKGVEVGLMEVEDLPVGALRPGEKESDMAMRRATYVNRFRAADAIIIGAPSYFGTMASPVKRLFEDCAAASFPEDRTRPWRLHIFRDKVGAAFAASGTPHGGNEQTLHSILTMMMHLGMIVVTPGQAQPVLENEDAPYGATTISGAEGNRLPTEAEQNAARALGQRVARVTAWLSTGRMEWDKQQAPR